MRSSNAAANVTPFPSKRAKTAERPKLETDFLPAALEIVETPPSPVGRAILATIAISAFATITWAAVGQVDIIATAQGHVIPTGKSKVIQPFDTGVVRAIKVTDGQSVKVGDVLVELDATSDSSDERKLAYALAQDRADVLRLKSLLSGLDRIKGEPGMSPQLVESAQQHMDAQLAELKAKTQTIERQIAQKRAEGREIAAAIAKLEASLPLLTEQRDIRGALLGNQYGSKLQYLQIQQQLVESQHELDGQKERKDENAQALAALTHQIEQAQAEYRKTLLTDLSKAQVQAIEHAQDISKSEMRRELRTLRAPVEGTVQQLAVHTLGGVVTPAEPLMVIVPKGASLEIEADLTNQDIGFVHRGQPVDVKIEAFDFTRYGLLHGTVLDVSQDAVPVNNGGRQKKGDRDHSPDEDPRSSQSSYVARIALREHELMTEQGLAPLGPGMTVTAEIKTGRRTIIGFLLSPLTRLRQQSLRER